MQSKDPREKTFGQLSVGDRFQIKPTVSSPKGQSPVFEKIRPERDPMYPDSPHLNYRRVNDPSVKNFLYNPTPVFHLVKEAATNP